MRTYTPEPKHWRRSRWADKPEGHRTAVINNRRRTGRAKSRKPQRLRSERVERSFAHTCETGGARRSWLRGSLDVTKHYLMTVAAHNLGRVLRKLFGVGKPKALQGISGLSVGQAGVLQVLLWVHPAIGRDSRRSDVVLLRSAA
jgi:transposase